MSDHRLWPAVIHHISDFLGFAVPVDRHAVGAEALRRIARLEKAKWLRSAMPIASPVPTPSSPRPVAAHAARSISVSRDISRGPLIARPSAISAIAVLPKLSASARGRNTTKIVLFRPKRPRRPGIIVRYFNGLRGKIVT
jgi:hypothetical protein